MSLGVHIGKTVFNETGKPHKSIEAAIEYFHDNFGISTLAMFTAGPMQKKLNHMNYENIKHITQKLNMPIYVHGSYVCVDIWHLTKHNQNESKFKISIKHMEEMFDSCDKIAARGLVVHVPRHNIYTVMETLELLCKDPKIHDPNQRVSLILEFPASTPQQLNHEISLENVLTYETPEKLNYFVKKIKDNKNIHLNTSICLDTCHLYAGGVNLANYEDWILYEHDMTEETKNNILLIHLNGAESKNFGRGKDGHVIPFSKHDAIWNKFISKETKDFLERISKEYKNKPIPFNFYKKLTKKEISDIKKSGLYGIVEFCKKRNISMIMEIDTSYYIETKFAIDIVNGLLCL